MSTPTIFEVCTPREDVRAGRVSDADLATHGTDVLSIRWDEDAGTFTGRDAERARELVRYAEQARFVAIHPHPCSHELSANPMRSRADLAAVFGRSYILPAILLEALPCGEGGDGDPGEDPLVRY